MRERVATHLARNTVVAAVAVAAVGAAAAPALGARDATPQERAAILRDVEPRYEYCFDVEVSTADATWGLFTTATPRPVGCDAVGDGFALVHQDRTGVWSSVLENAGDQGTCPDVGIPTPVGVDLKVCFAPVPRAKTTMTCFKGAKPRAARTPRNCRTLGPATNPIRLTKLRWKRWGADRAVATGRTSRGRVSVQAYRPITLSGARFYTRLRVTGGGWGRTTVALAAPWGDYDYASR